MRRPLAIVVAATVLLTTPLASADTARPQVIGGESSPSTRYDSVAVVDSGSSSCTGTLVASTWLLTAGHCVKGDGIVRGGPQAMSDPAWSSTAAGTAHPGAGRGTNGRTDVGLFELDEPQRPSTSFELRSADVGPGSTVEIVGWGTTGNGRPPKVLTAARLEVRDPAECRDHFTAGSFDARRMLCLRTDGRSACHGDSGGPVLSGPDLIGIVTYVTPECAGYTVALRADAIEEWIDTTIRDRQSRSARTSRRADTVVDAWHRADAVVLAATASPADQAVASALAATMRSPLLLSERDHLTAGTAAALDRLRPGTALVVGGTGAIGEAVLRDLARREITSRRLAGRSAQETAVVVSRSGHPDSSGVAVITASAEVREWTLAAGAAALHDAPLFLLPPGAPHAGVLDELERLGVTRLHVVGAIDEATMRALRGLAEVTHVNQREFTERALVVWSGTARPRSDTALVPKSEAGAAFLLVPLVAMGTGTSIFVVPDRCVPAGVAAAIDRSHPPVVLLVDPLPDLESLSARC